MSLSRRVLPIGLLALSVATLAFARGHGHRGGNAQQAGNFNYWLMSLSWSPSYCVTHPDDERLIKERDEVHKKLIDLSEDILERRKSLDQSFREWDQKIVQERIEKQMIDQEIKENEGKDEQQEFENK